MMANTIPIPSRVKDVRIVSTCPRMSMVVPRGRVAFTLPRIRVTSFAKEPRSRWSGLAYTSKTGWTS